MVEEEVRQWNKCVKLQSLVGSIR